MRSSSDPILLRETASEPGCPEQLSLPAPPKKRPAASDEAEEQAKVAVARRAKPSPVPGHVRVTLTLELERGLAERLVARALREGKNLEAIVLEILKAAGQ